MQENPRNLGFEVVPRLAGQHHFVGIWLSHRKALETALDAPDPGAFVLLEDDVSIDPKLWTSQLELGARPGSDWEIILLSPRYRRPRNKVQKSEPNKWIKAPFGQKPILLREARREYVCTGAHFCIFRNKKIIEKVIKAMDDCTALYDVDLFYITQFNTYGLHDNRVTTAHYGSDHN